MSGKRGGRRANYRPEKPLICAFYEGESEKQYLQQLKERYCDTVIIKIVSKPGLFKEAVSQFEKNSSLLEEAEVTDEIWFLFDVRDTDTHEKEWASILPSMKKLRKMRKPGIRVRLLMTTGCLEYWLMLHFQRYCPAIRCKEERDRVESDLNSVCQKRWNLPYKKGDPEIIRHIFEEIGLDAASENGKFYLAELEKEGLPPLDNPSEPDNRQLDRRYQWLLSCEKTFTTVQEAIAAFPLT